MVYWGYPTFTPKKKIFPKKIKKNLHMSKKSCNFAFIEFKINMKLKNKDLKELRNKINNIFDYLEENKDLPVRFNIDVNSKNILGYFYIVEKERNNFLTTKEKNV